MLNVSEFRERGFKMNTEVMFSSKTEDWETPQWLYEALDERYHFTLDPCASEENHKCDVYFTKEEDGLAQDWGNHTVFCNPPYGRGVEKWVKACYYHALNGRGDVVMLLPARTDTKWFHIYMWNCNFCRIEFLRGRLKFGNAKNSAPFPSIIVWFKKVEHGK